MDLTEESHLADEIEQADGFKERIYSAMVRIDSQMTVPVTSESAPSAVDTPHSPAAPRGNRIKLPKLTLRPFNGDVTTWTTFWDFL